MIILIQMLEEDFIHFYELQTDVKMFFIKFNIFIHIQSIFPSKNKVKQKTIHVIVRHQFLN